MRHHSSKIILVVVLFTLLVASVLPAVAQSIQRKQAWASTVRITMYAPEMVADNDTADDDLPIPPDEKRPLRATGNYVVSEGLGTILREGDDIVIVTHDHYSMLDRSLGTVQFRNQDNALIMEMPLLKYKRLIRQRDGGTTIVEAPPRLVSHYLSSGNSLSQMASGSAANKGQVAPEDRVWIVRRDPDNTDILQVTEAAVEAWGERQGRPVFRLRNLDGQPISGGDSGGGVWHDGQLVANLWTTIMLENVATNAQRPTDFSLAAINS